MAGMSQPPVSTRFLADLSPAARLWLATPVLFMIPLFWDLTGLDGWVMQQLADSNGFPLRHQWWLEKVMHDAARHLATVVYVGVLVDRKSVV